MTESDALAALQKENARLIALLEANGIEWRLAPEPEVLSYCFLHHVVDSGVIEQNVLELAITPQAIRRKFTQPFSSLSPIPRKSSETGIAPR